MRPLLKILAVAAVLPASFAHGIGMMMIGHTTTGPTNTSWNHVVTKTDTSSTDQTTKHDFRIEHRIEKLKYRIEKLAAEP